MSWTLTYSPWCDVDILHMHYRAAERVCAAVVAFAKDGSGDVEPVYHDEEDPEALPLFCVRARGGFALVRIDQGAETAHVSRILPDRLTRRMVPLLGRVVPTPEEP